jgi:hypothetical protein
MMKRVLQSTAPTGQGGSPPPHNGADKTALWSVHRLRTSISNQLTRPRPLDG